MGYKFFLSVLTHSCQGSHTFIGSLKIMTDHGMHLNAGISIINNDEYINQIPHPSGMDSSNLLG